jgi:hypothetical protein
MIEKTGGGGTKGYQTCMDVGTYIRANNKRVFAVDTYRDHKTVTRLSDQRARFVSISSTGDVRIRG